MIRAALAALLVLVCVLVLPGRANAATELRASVDRDTVGVGDLVHYTLEASSTDDTPSGPQPGKIDGFVLRGTSIAPSQFTMSVNGNVTRRQSITATWTLEAIRQGRFTLGPAKATVSGALATANPVPIKVVAAGAAPPPPPQQQPFSPFDFWKGFQGANEPPQAPEQVTVDPKLALDAVRAPGLFLHATLDKTQVVVGEQVTLSIYLYTDASENRFELGDEHEATANDFVKRSILLEGSDIKVVGFGEVAGHPWEVKLVRRWALFPLKTGDLEVGPMTVLAYRSRRTPAVRRDSETLHVRVVEPPVAGRPPGYVVGDVGSYQLTADVAPRAVEQDGAIAVTVELSGTGNLPSTLTVPSRPGVEWLEPQMSEKLGLATNERFGGKRTFTYVVRLHKEGDVDLGEMAFPYWDPDAHKYLVARAPLGSVHVTASGKPKPVASDEPIDPLKALPPPRPLGAGVATASAKGVRVADSPLFWLGLGLTPFAWVVALGARAATRRLRRRAAVQGASPTAELKERMRAAEKASEQGDGRATDAATARVLETAAVALSGVNLRAATAEEAVERLSAKGVPSETAREVFTLLRECEAARFSPDAPDAEGARGRWQRARKLVGRMKGGT